MRSTPPARPWLGLGLLALTACAGGGDSGMQPMIATVGGATTDDPPSSSGPDDDSGSATTGIDTGNETSVDSTGAGSTGETMPPNLDDGTWEFINVSNTQAMSLHPTRTRIDDGTEILGWAETTLDDISQLNMFGAIETGELWSVSPLTNADRQHTFPTIAGGEVAYLAWMGQVGSDDDRDLYFATATAGGWTTPRNLTNAFDVPTPLNESEPAIGHRGGGELFIAYTSAEQVDPLAPAPTPGVFVLEMTADNDPAGQTQLVSPTQAHCTDLTAAAAGDGTGHVIAKCTDGGLGVLIHGTDRSGSWDADTLSGTTTGLLSPALSAGADGNVHLVWIQDSQCGATACDDVYYATTTDHVFGTPVQVTDTANLDERFPAVGMDEWGRVVVFSQARIDGQAILYMNVSEDGQSFSPSVRISPQGTLDDYQNPHDVLFSPEGFPSFAYERVVDGSDPLNIDIEVARFLGN